MKTVVVSVLSCSSCTDIERRTKNDLEAIGSIVSIQPKEALSKLDSMGGIPDASKKLRAEYSLLYSIALDKNFIDICSDSIISPAIRFYSRLDDKDKPKCLYYYSRIFENNGDYESAMKWLVKAEDILKQESDAEICQLIYAAKGRIYYKMLDYTEAAANYHKAADHCLSEASYGRYLSNRLREADCLLMCNQAKSAEIILSDLESAGVREFSEKTSRLFYQLKVRLSEELYPDRTYDILQEYLTEHPAPLYIDWLMTARVYINCNKADKALEALRKHSMYHHKDEAYHFLSGKANEMTGNYHEALEEYKQYIYSSGTLGSKIISQDTKFIEEREMHLGIHEREKNRIITLSLMVAVILLALSLAGLAILTIRNKLKIECLQRENLQCRLDELMLEREELAQLENKNKEGRKIISERLRIIDQFVMSDAFSDSVFETKASETLKEIICNRTEFVRQNRLIFNQSSPKFIDYLLRKGLTDIEIDHCCLYAIGMNGKMVTTFTNAKRHYHIGSDVRKKLGLSTHDTNISIYIRNLYNQMHS